MQSVGADLTTKQRVLFLTVVEHAIRDTMEPKPTVRQAALDWLLRDEADFPDICYLAGLDADYLRKRIASRFAAS